MIWVSRVVFKPVWRRELSDLLMVWMKWRKGSSMAASANFDPKDLSSTPHTG